LGFGPQTINLQNINDTTATRLQLEGEPLRVHNQGLSPRKNETARFPDSVGSTILLIPHSSPLAMALDNENPLILSASELPTRKQRRKNKELSSKQHAVKDMLSSKLCSADPFDLSDSSDTDSNDSVEPIDEMEIYGKLSELKDLHMVASCTFLSAELSLVASGYYYVLQVSRMSCMFWCSYLRNWREWTVLTI
jgi:hypothetical protein